MMVHVSEARKSEEGSYVHSLDFSWSRNRVGRGLRRKNWKPMLSLESREIAIEVGLLDYIYHVSNETPKLSPAGLAPVPTKTH